MSMDQVLPAVNDFRKVLSDFNNRFKETLRDLEEADARAAPHWSDVGKEEYDGRWHPLKNTVETYLRVEAPAYEHFLDEQYHLIRQFIYGRNRR